MTKSAGKGARVTYRVEVRRQDGFVGVGGPGKWSATGQTYSNLSSATSAARREAEALNSAARIVASDGRVVKITEQRPIVHVTEASGSAEGMSENRSREFMNRFLPPARRKVKAQSCDVVLDGEQWTKWGGEGAPKSTRLRVTTKEREEFRRLIRGMARENANGKGSDVYILAPDGALLETVSPSPPGAGKR
jgi:hypothetical protein